MGDDGASEIWREPVRGGYPDPRLIALTGRERLGVFRLGKAPFPPLFHLTGGRPTRFGSGTTDAEMPATEWLVNPSGLVSGGVLSILADIALGCAVQTELPAATPYTSAELSLSLLRPVRPGGVVTASAQAIHVGRSVALSECFILGPDGETLVAHGTSRCAVLPPVEPRPEAPAELPDVEPPASETPDPYQRAAPTDGIVSSEEWATLSGREILERQVRGETPPPPIHFLTGLTLSSVGHGTAEMRLPAVGWLTSPLGLLQGGTITMLADAAMLSAVMTTTPPGTAIAGLDLKVNFLRPAPPDGRDLVARAEAIHSGRTIAIATSRVENADGKPVLLATGSAMLLPGRPPDLGDVELAESQEDQ
jgi:uncharacterized protein (TIGR00369 family)